MNRRPDSIPGLLLEVAKIRLRRPGPRRALAAAGALLPLGVISLLSSAHSPAARESARPVAAYEMLPAYPAGVCEATGARCDAHSGCAGDSRCVYPVRVAVPRIDAGALATQVFSPTLAYGRNGFGAAWIAVEGMHTELYFASVDGDGNRERAPVRVTNSPEIKIAPQLVSYPTGYGAVWTAEDHGMLSVYFARLSPEGKLQGAPVALGGTGGFRFYARAAWDGAAWGVAYYDFVPPASFNVQFVRLSDQGRVLGTRTVAREQFPTSALALTFTGAKFALGWNDFVLTSDQTAVKTVQITKQGDPGTVLTLGRRDGMNSAMEIDGMGESTLAVFADETLREDTSTLWFARATDSRVTVPPRAVTDGTSMVFAPSFAHSGDGLGVSFVDERSGRNEVYFQRLDGDGTLVGGAVRVTDSSLPIANPALASGPQNYGLAWEAGSVANNAIYFVRLNTAGARVGREVNLSAR